MGYVKRSRRHQGLPQSGHNRGIYGVDEQCAPVVPSLRNRSMRHPCEFPCAPLHRGMQQTLSIKTAGIVMSGVSPFADMIMRPESSLLPTMTAMAPISPSSGACALVRQRARYPCSLPCALFVQRDIVLEIRAQSSLFRWPRPVF